MPSMSCLHLRWSPWPCCQKRKLQLSYCSRQVHYIIELHYNLSNNYYLGLCVVPSVDHMVTTVQEASPVLNTNRHLKKRRLRKLSVNMVEAHQLESLQERIIWTQALGPLEFRPMSRMMSRDTWLDASRRLESLPFLVVFLSVFSSTEDWLPECLISMKISRHYTMSYVFFIFYYFLN